MKTIAIRQYKICCVIILFLLLPQSGLSQVTQFFFQNLSQSTPQSAVTETINGHIMSVNISNNGSVTKAGAAVHYTGGNGFRIGVSGSLVDIDRLAFKNNGAARTYTITGNAGQSITVSLGTNERKFIEVGFLNLAHINVTSISNFSANIDFFEISERNVSPVLTSAITSIDYLENDDLLLDDMITLTDANGDSDWDGGKMKLQMGDRTDPEDELRIEDLDGDGTAITISGTNIYANGTDIGDLSVSGGVVSGGTALEVTFDDDATISLVQEVIQSFRYRSLSENPQEVRVLVQIVGNDRKGGFAFHNINLNLMRINDAPVFTLGNDPVAERNSGSVSISNFITGIDDGDDAGQTLTFSISNDNNELFSAQPTINYTNFNTVADLNFTVAPNVLGQANVTVTLTDNAGTSNGGENITTKTFTINVFPPVFINEVDADASHEFVEIYDGGVGNTDLSGLSLVWFNGNGDVSYKSIDITGSTDASGFYVLGVAGTPNLDQDWGSTALQNGADAVAIYARGASDFPAGTPPTQAGLVDALVYGSNDPDDSELLTALGKNIQINESAGSNASLESMSRFTNGSFGLETPTPGQPNGIFPELLSVSRASNTLLLLKYNKPVQTNGTNPSDFQVTDALGVNYTVTAQADGSPADDEIELTVSDFNSAAGDLTITYTNANNEIRDLFNNAVTNGQAILDDVIAPTIINATIVDNTHLTLVFSEPVQTDAGNPGFFVLQDGLGNRYNVTDQADGTPNDNQIDLTVESIANATGDLTFSYSNPSQDDEIRDFGGNILQSSSVPLSIEFDGIVPTMSNAVKDSETQITVNFSEPVQLGNSPDLASFTVTDGLGTTHAVTALSDGIAGDNSILLSFSDLSMANGDLTVTYTNLNNAVTDFGGNVLGSDATGQFINSDTAPPNVVAAIKEGNSQITLIFNEAVFRSQLQDGQDFEVYDSRGFQYEVLALKDDIPLDNRLELEIEDLSLAIAPFTISYNKNEDIIEDYGANELLSFSVLSIDSGPATVVNITSTSANGNFGIGQLIPIQVVFNEAVTVTGTPQLTLETGNTDQVIDYVSGSGTTTLVFNYTIQAGDESTDLDYANRNALTAGASIQDAMGDPVSLLLPAPGATGSLADNKALVIDGIVPAPPTVSGVNNDTGFDGADGITNDNTLEINGTAEPNASIEVFLESVSIGTTAANPSGNWTFDHTASILADGVHVVTTVATDLAGNASTPSDSFTVTIDTNPSTVSNINSSLADGAYGVGQVIPIEMTFNENVTVTGTPQLTLETGNMDRMVDYTSGSGTNILTFNYTIQEGDESLDLDYLNASALTEGTSVQDLAGNNALLTLPVPGSQGSLGANKELIVDGVIPASPVIIGIDNDSGSDSSDGITNDNTIVFNGTAEANSSVEVFLEGISIGAVNVDGDGNWSFDHTGTTLPDDVYNITAATSDAAGNSSALSSNFSLTIDTVAPTLQGATKDSNTEITVLFDEVVTFFAGDPTQDFEVKDGLNGQFDIVVAQPTPFNPMGLSLTVADLSTAVGDLTIAYTHNGDLVADPAGNILTTDITGVIIDNDAIAPTLLSATLQNTTQITLEFNEPVQTNGGNPSDFIITDGAGISHAVISQSDDTANDNKIVLTTADLNNAAGDITIRYENNNGEISDFGGNLLQTGDIVIDDATTPTMTNATRESDTQITLAFSEPVQTNNGNPTDFAIVDEGGTTYTVLSQMDGTANDNLIVLNTSDFSSASGDLIITYTNNHNEVSDFGQNTLQSDLTGVRLDRTPPEMISWSRDNFNLIVTFSEPFTVHGLGLPSGIFVFENGAGEMFTSSPFGEGSVRKLTFFSFFANANIGNVLGDITLSYTNDNDRITDLSGNVFPSTVFFMDMDTVTPTLTNFAKTSNTELALVFSEEVRVTGNHHADFELSDEMGTLYAVSAISDGIAKDQQVLLTVADLSGAIGDLTLKYTNNNNAIEDFGDNQLADIQGLKIDVNPPIMLEVVNSGFQLFNEFDIVFSETVELTSDSPIDFVVKNSLGQEVQAALLVDRVLRDSILHIVLTSTTEFQVAGDLTFTYINNKDQVMDLVGLALETDNVGVVLDRTPPAMPVISGISSDTGADNADGITNDNTLHFNGTAEMNSTVEVFIEGTSIGTTTAGGNGDWNIDHTGTALAEGLYSVTANATDSNQNTSDMSLAFSLNVDTSAPASPSITGISDDTGFNATDLITKDNTLIVSGTSEAGSTISIYLTGQMVGTTVADGNGDWSFDGTASSLNDGVYTLNASATDIAGNPGLQGPGIQFTIDSNPATILNVTSSLADGTYGIGQVIPISVSFSELVVVTGTPQLSLETGMTDRTVDYASGSGTNTHIFNYTVQAGDESMDLDYLNTSSLTAGTSIQDLAGNNAILTLEAPGDAGSLGNNKDLVIDGIAPVDPTITVPGSTIITNAQNQTLSGTHSEDGVIISIYEDADNDGVADTNSALASTAVTSNAWSFTLTLTLNTTRDFVIRAEDAVSNQSNSVNIPSITQDSIDPVITSDGGGVTAAINTAENQTSVTTLTATDVNGISFSISGGVDQNLFELNGAGLTFKNAPDFETPTDDGTDNTYVVEVTATDDAGNTDRQTITITVTDETEVANFTIDAIADVTVAENAVYTGPAPALSGDAPIGSLIYALSGTDAAAFAINATTGVVSMIARDFEAPADANTDNVYELTITVTDSDNNTDSEDWTVTVTDETEVASFTIGAIANATVAENTAYTGPTPVLSGDTPIGTVGFTLGGADAEDFTIDAGTGVVSMIARDFENPADTNTDNVYELTITVTDSDNNTDSEDWTVIVTDETEMANFTIDAIANATVAENAVYTGPIPTLSGDTPIGIVTYTLGGADAEDFTINAGTGVVSMIARDFENPADANTDNIYELTITVTDSDNNADSENWTVTVTDVTEVANLTIDTITNATVAENIAYTGPTPVLSGDAPIGTVAFTLGGTDAEDFNIDAATGVVGMIARDFESPTDVNTDNVYELTITVTDSDNNTDSENWTVTVTDVTEVANLTIDAITNATVAENIAYTGPTPVLSGDAPIGTVAFTLGGTDAEDFTINAATGVVSMIARDFEAPADANTDNVYELTITVTDSDNNTDSEDWTMTVTDETEVVNFTIDAIANTTVAENTIYTGTSPNLSGQTPIGTVTYTLGGTDAAAFTIDAGTGVVNMIARDFESAADANTDNVYELTITVTDSDNNTDSENWTVTVNDVTEVANFTIDAIANNTVAENASYTGPTPTLSGHAPISTVTYTLGGTDAEDFTINAVTGVVSMIERDFENPADANTDNIYEVSITATDADSNSATTSWTVTVTDETEVVNFTIDAITDANVAENTAYTGPTPALSGDAPIGSLTYALGGADAEDFTINATTGVVSMIARDFESPADANTDNIYELTIMVTDSDNNADSEDWTVTVTDETEVANFNIDAIANANVAENTAYTGPTPALSGDAPIGSVTYTLGGADAQDFTINASTGVVSMIARDFESPADADADNIYELIITVTDSDNNADSEDWTVTITDETEVVNFTINAMANANMVENIAYIGPTPALSGDTPIGTVTYTLGGTDAEDFTINAVTGVVSMIARDFEAPADANTDNVYEVSITATDNDGNTDSEEWTVTVTDALESAIFMIDEITDVSIAENIAYTGPTPNLSGDAPRGSLIYTLDGADATSFTIDPGTGVVSMITRDFESPMDGNSDNTYSLRITATDNDGNHDSEAWIVTVTDVIEVVNFTISAISDANVAENATYTGPAPTLSGDTPIGSLTYTLGGIDAEDFTINASSGVVSMIARDFENPADANTDNVYTISITATDEDNNAATVSWTVTVTDENEVASFTIDAISDANVPENANYTGPTPTLSGDAPIGSVAYALGGTDAAAFIIDAATGVVSMIARDFENPLDTNMDNVYALSVIATDADNNSTTTSWTITVTDVTEVINFAIEAISDASISENEVYFGSTPTLSGDSPIGTVTYTLSGTDAANFTIDANTGVVNMVGQNFEAPADANGDNIHEVTIIATDMAGNSDEESWKVTITDVVELASFVITDIPDISVDENTDYTSSTPGLSGNTPIGNITYTLSGTDAEHFTINGNLGVVSMVARDFESPADENLDNRYEVGIVVTDSDGNQATQNWIVTITDKNDNSPVITSGNGAQEFSLNFSENQKSVTTISATDPDVTSTINYELSGGTDQALFSIESGSGSLSFITAPDFENPADGDQNNIYVVEVSATDGIQSDTQIIQVVVTDVDEIAPAPPILSIISDDSGSSGTDRITNDNTLLFIGTAEANSQVELFIDGISKGSTQTDASGNFTFDHTNTSLADGNYQISATATDELGNISEMSTTLQVLIDTSSPILQLSSEASNIVNGSFNVSITTSELVSGFSLDDIVVTNAQSSDLMEIVAGSQWTVSITPSSDGNIEIVVPMNALSDIAGNNNDKASNSVFRSYDGTAPEITAVQLLDNNPIPTGTSIVNFQITFSEQVSGFDLTDLNVTLSGTAEAKVGSVSEIEPNLKFNIEVIDLLGQGTIGLALGENHGISDAAGNGLAAISNNPVYTTNFIPTDVVLSPSIIAENNELGALVGSLSTSDADNHSSYSYRLVSGTGDTHNELFSVNENELLADVIFDFETQSNYSIRVETNDGLGGRLEKELSITIENVEEASIAITGNLQFEPTALSLSQELTINIANTGEKSVEILVSATPDGFSVIPGSITLDVGNDQDLTIKFSPTEVKTYSGNIIFSFDGTSESIDVSGEGSLITGIGEPKLQDKHVSIHPNPAERVLTIDLSQLSGTDLSIQIINANGRTELHKTQLSPSVLEMDVSTYSAGIYLIAISNGHSVLYKKVIIRR